jgi:son of sevenless
MPGLTYTQKDEPETKQDQQSPLTPFWCQARFDYKADDPSALSFSCGDVIEVYNQLESGWWDGVLNNERGWFPSNFVILLSDEEVQRLSSYFKTGEFSLDPAIDFHDAVDDSTLEGGSLWVPDVTNDGQVSFITPYF